MYYHFNKMDPCLKRNYSYSYRDTDLCFETGYFGLKVNSLDLTTVKFGLFDDRNNDFSYFEALSKNKEGRMHNQLIESDLTLEISHLKDGDIDSSGNIDSDDFVTHRIVSADKSRLWESGRIAQHYDFKQLAFRQTHGDAIDSNKIIDQWDVTLYILVWPQSITFTLETVKKNPSEDFIQSLFKSLFIKIEMKGWRRTQSFTISENSNCQTSLICNFDKTREIMKNGVNIRCAYASPKQPLHTKLSERFGCYFISKHGLIQRSFKDGYTDIRDYDVFHIIIDNNSETDLYVPTLLFVQHLANPTGLCPIVCDINYVPTGIHIQLSKNWHNKKMPSYGRLFTFLPVKANSRIDYHIRIPYSFYGQLPTASHSNLSLIGYGPHGGRWEQLAIGSFGETYCMDMDMDCVEQTVTDIRMLYTKGEDEKLWGWSDAGWGGDWLQVSDENKRRLMPFSWKTAYEAHGPCLTSMLVDGWYKNDAGDRVQIYSSVNTLRTDDYARTFTSISYSFTNNLPTDNTHFFSLGSTPRIATPLVAYGSKDGLYEQIDLSTIEVQPDEYVINRKEMKGSPPWFIAFPGQKYYDDKTWGKGFRSIVITKYQASINKVKYQNPSISLIGCRKSSEIKSIVRLALVPPAGVQNFSGGDKISLDLYVATFPMKASDYYGTNEAFKNHLNGNQDSWKNVYREVVQNDLEVSVMAGVLESKYPIVIKALSSKSINISIKGGVGMVPLKVVGLQSKNYVLKFQGKDGNYKVFEEQSVHGKDFWQTDFDAVSGYTLVFNIPTDETEPLRKWKLEYFG